MAKIGILTFHRSINYGAFLQSYSLCKRLEMDFLEHEVEIINYATERVFKNYTIAAGEFIFGTKENPKKLRAIIYSALAIMKDRKLLERKKRLNKAFFHDLQYLKLSEDEYITDDYSVFFDKIKDKYDVIIVGSDCVWEAITYPFPNAYFLNGDIGRTVRMSFAASSDRMHYTDLDDESATYIREALSKLSYIGIRDVATENFIKNIYPEAEYFHNCDPSVFLDISSTPANLERVKDELRANGIDLNKPIIGIMGSNDMCGLIRRMFGKRYQIVAVYENCKDADYYLNDLTPFEWARVFSLFKITFTRFFHGSIFSLKNATPTITFDYWYMKDSEHKTKICDLYDRLELKEHYFRGKPSYTDEEVETIKARAQYFIDNPDKQEISAALGREAKSYTDFKSALSNILDAIKNQ